MSIGNLKTDGNKSNNFPWQYKMLQGLQEVIDSNNTCCDNTQILLNNIYTLLEGTTRIPAIVSATGVGATPNAYSVSIANVGAAAGVINGVSVPAGTTLNFDGGLNNVLSPMSYNATGTTFIITSIS